MKNKCLLHALFICMGILLAIMYGLFELRGWDMGTRGKWILKIIVILFIAIIALVLIFLVCDLGNGSNGAAHFDENEIACEVSNVFIMRSQDKKVEIPQGVQAIFYMGDDRLVELDEKTLSSLKYVHFLGRRHEISKSLYVKLVNNNVSVICKDGVLNVCDEKSSFFVRTFRKPEETSKNNSVKISGQVDISSGTK